MAYDLEQHGLAQRYLIQALGLARGADDHALGGEILAGMAHQAVYMGQPAHALDLARAAQLAGPPGGGHHAARRPAHVLEAHAHAGLGDARACAGSLHEAERAFDRAQPRRRARAGSSYFDEAYLAAKFAHCFRDLGDGERAVRQARRSLDMDGRYVRGRMFNLSLLAAGLLQCGRAGGGLHGGGGGAGRWPAAPVRPVPVLRGRPARRLEPYRKEPAVVALHERTRELV